MGKVQPLHRKDVHAYDQGRSYSVRPGSIDPDDFGPSLRRYSPVEKMTPVKGKSDPSSVQKMTFT
jgi:hypothetical protein